MARRKKSSKHSPSDGNRQKQRLSGKTGDDHPSPDNRWLYGHHPVVVVGHHRPYVETPKILVVHGTTRRRPANLMPPQVKSDAASGKKSSHYRGGVDTHLSGRCIGVPGPGLGHLHAVRDVDHPAVARQPSGRTG